MPGKEHKPEITDMVIIGDSLSDRGAMACRKLLGVIPMDELSGLSGKSPDGRFADGLSWSDYVGRAFGTMSKYEEIKLGDPSKISTNSGEILVRTYCEGGATSHKYSDRFTLNPVTAATQQILKNLGDLRQQLFDDDHAMGTRPEQKKKTLVVEWSGANDLITINTDYDLGNAEKAIAARIHNIEEMIKNGYCNFCLFELPDLSLTPRFQAKSESDRKSIQGVCQHFNSRLRGEIEKLKSRHSDCHFNIYDTNTLFQQAFKKPETYGFDKSKLKTPFTTCKDFSADCDPALAKPFMFWDDVHPTSKVGHLLADDFLKQVQQRYKIFAPKERLVQIFRERYGLKLAAEKKVTFIGRFRSSNIAHKKLDLTVGEIVRHALREDGGRSREVMRELGWIDEKDNCLICNDLVENAIAGLEEKPKGCLDKIKCCA